MAFTSQTMRVDPELKTRIDSLGENASLSEIFQAIHEWTKEQIAENERRQRIFARTGRYVDESGREVINRRKRAALTSPYKPEKPTKPKEIRFIRLPGAGPYDCGGNAIRVVRE